MPRENYTWTAGQKVFEPSRSGWGGFPGRAFTIDRVTPSGRAVVGSTQYDREGRALGSRSASGIVPFTEEHQAELDLFARRREASDLANKIKWRTLEPEQSGHRTPCPARLDERARGVTRILTLPLKREYFEAIRTGSKPEEFRFCTEFWTKRLAGRTYDRIELTMGYPKAGDQSRRLSRAWRGYQVRTITHPHFGPDPVEVFAIDVSKPVCL